MIKNKTKSYLTYINKKLCLKEIIMKGKKYRDITNGKVLTITDVFEDTAILDNNSKIKVNRLFDNRYFEEYVDTTTFFNNESLLDGLSQKIQQIPDSILNSVRESNANDIVVNGEGIGVDISKSLQVPPNFNTAINEGPAVLPYDPEEERLEILKKYGYSDSQNNNQPTNKFDELLNEFDNRLKPKKDDENNIQRVEVNRDEIINTPKAIIVEDPIIQMFKNVKRNTDLKITIDIENKIPRHDFIEMMEDSYTTSIIDFLAEEFTNKLLSDYNSLKETFKKEIIKSISNKSAPVSNTPSIKEEIKVPVKRAPRKNKNTSIKDDRSTIN